MKMNRKFKLTILTLAAAGTLCSCSNTTSEATPTPDSSPMATPENRSGIVGYGYDGYSGYNYGMDNNYANGDYGNYYANPDGGMWNDGTAAQNAGDAIGQAANDIGNAARGAANDVRRGINDMARNVEQGTSTTWLSAIILFCAGRQSDGKLLSVRLSLKSLFPFRAFFQRIPVLFFLLVIRTR